MRRAAFPAVCLAVAGLLVSPLGRADDEATAPPEPEAAEAAPDDESADALARARALFREGTTLAADARWADALERFEAAQAVAPHPGTTYNIGICERALGRLTRARATFRRALSEAETTPIAEGIREDMRAYLGEIEAALAHVTVSLDPADAAIVVDGRPLKLQPAADDEGAEAALPRLVAGLLPPGRGEPPPEARFRLVVDPGRHVILISRSGFDDVLVERTFAPGSESELDLTLSRLPATLRVGASEPSATVALDGLDVGLTPVTLSRPAGSYHVLVRKSGFEAYEADVSLEAAQETDLLAKLQPESIGLHERWWFWATLAGSVATVAVVTWAVTRPEPERPPLDGGSLGWSIRVP